MNTNPKFDPKFEVGDHARISRHKNIFTKRYTDILQIGPKSFCN